MKTKKFLAGYQIVTALIVLVIFFGLCNRAIMHQSKIVVNSLTILFFVGIVAFKLFHAKALRNNKRDSLKVFSEFFTMSAIGFFFSVVFVIVKFAIQGHNFVAEDILACIGFLVYGVVFYIKGRISRA